MEKIYEQIGDLAAEWLRYHIEANLPAWTKSHPALIGLAGLSVSYHWIECSYPKVCQVKLYKKGKLIAQRITNE